MAYNEKDLRSKAEAYLAAERNDVFKAEVEAELEVPTQTTAPSEQES